VPDDEADSEETSEYSDTEYFTDDEAESEAESEDLGLINNST